MNNNKQAITIKGTKDGLTFIIDETCSFDQILKELETKLSSSVVDKDHPMVKVNIHLGNRYLTKEMKDDFLQIVRSKNNLIINEITSNVITKHEAKEWQKDLEVSTITRMVRAGQTVHVQGDLLLVGDVNPGGSVSATGNIYILGRLNGIAHAGLEGDRQAVVVAAYMNPTQLRIADLLSRSPDFATEGVYMECAYVDEEHDKILIDRIQMLSNLRPNLRSMERRISNG
ncbi:septum site-determining protein MinC [Salinibacillus xinjiangensis]|uniref:Probable septum site-determining protein MinC n=1 Tax=Salinibacillus xinjiangensis TaxID=1229268 RepID=A0A6G1XB31_9BACI|nr:septum site-determining protein MinC [Salinibacillus xinjiangensis]MRG88223.1 septum site-determining protein MinC [Salinibacillus xinjiangensis]